MNSWDEAATSRHAATQLPTIRHKLAMVVLACVLPSLLGLGPLIAHLYATERARLEQDALRTARALSAAVDHELGVGENVALALATSANIANNNLAAFHAQAKSLLRDEFPGFTFVLSDSGGHQVVNTLRPFGEPLPDHGNPEQWGRVFAQGKPFISDLFIGGVTRVPLIAIDVPVWRDGKVAYDLAVAIRPERLERLLAEQHLPPDHVVSILDTKGIHVARTHAPELYIGQPGSPPLLLRMREVDEGLLETNTIDGIPVFAAFKRSAATGWTVAVGIPTAEVAAELLHSVSLIALVIIALLATGAGAAWILGGRIGRSVRSLTAPALALGSGRPVVSPPPYFREAVEVATVLKKVEAELDRHRHHRNALEAERQAAFTQLAANRDFISDILDSVASHIAILDADGTIVDVNGPWRKFAHGNSLPPEWTGVGTNYLSACRAATGADRAPALAAADGIEQVLAGRQTDFALEYPCHGPDRKRWFRMRVTPLRGGQGRAVVCHDDITDLKVTEAALRQSEDRLALATRGARIGIWDWDIATNALVWSDAVFAQLGLAGSDTTPSFAEFLARVHPDDRARLEHDIGAALRGDAAMDTELRIIRPDGGMRYLKCGGQVFRDADGAPVRMVGTSIDITQRSQDLAERKRIELRLGELLDLNQKIITECPVGIIAFKATGECVLANDAYARIVGETLESVRSFNFLDLPTWTDTGLLDAALAALATGEPRQVSIHHITPSGREVWADALFVPFASGGEPHLLCIKNDTTEQTRTNDQLAAARDKAEGASRAKSEFVANMSHEIRTPMNAIIGLSRLLDDSALGERERDYVAKIKISAQSLLGILNDILDFSKIEAGRLELEHTPFSIEDVLRNIAVVVSTNAGDKGIETVFALAPDVPTRLIGDPLRLQQVLLNLTGNAVKFTDSGEVVLSIAKVAEDEAGVTLQVSVRDTGIGIPVDQQEGLFAAFSQADSSTSRRYGGSGLGLTISSRLVALMGGAIHFTSLPGQGSDFRFTARFGRAAGAAPARASAGLGDLAVLVVDDNDTAREVLVQTCRSFRWRTEAAPSAAAALDLLRGHTAANRDPDILMLDWRMPGMDGVDMLRVARADPAIRLPKVILMVTAFGRDGVAGAVHGLPIDAILAKPATPSAIFDAVARVRGGSESPAAMSPLMTPLAGRLAGLRLLLVEDHKINQDVARDVLLRAGASVVVAGDGRAAVEVLETRRDHFDAVLMDLQMPGMDGYEATRVIRTRLGLTALPIIAMTANAMASDREKSLRAGMNAHVAKPIDVDEMIDTIARQAGGRAPPPAPPARTAPPADPPGASPPGLDLKSALIRLGGDRQLFLSLLGRFEESQGSTVGEARRLLAEGAGEQAAHDLHRLRGVAANLGAVDVARLASAAEAAIKDGRTDTLPELLAGLDAAMAMVFDAARQLAEPAPVDPPAAAVDLAALRPDLARLAALLRRRDLAAIDQFQGLRPAIAAAFGAAAVRDLAAAIDSLDFALALDLTSTITDGLQREGDA